ncbi:hypothetical protein SKAU_G00303140 [Synaphobranchus kaupii]|uniref:Uncharacterized protein n=1 Tax=Synaphobranchus kaupii TaxID=118154 RepID=A0A9Q1INI0_SYNKA|nr:hypothetical protein SKAU_G00303140 [Synaphobranchus kaupii]
MTVAKTDTQRTPPRNTLPPVPCPVLVIVSTRFPATPSRAISLSANGRASFWAPPSLDLPDPIVQTHFSYLAKRPSDTMRGPQGVAPRGVALPSAWRLMGNGALPVSGPKRQNFGTSQVSES